MSPGQMLRELRYARRWTQQVIADFVGIDRSYWAALERDKSSPSIATMERYGGMLGMEFFYGFRPKQGDHG